MLRAELIDSEIIFAYQLAVVGRPNRSFAATFPASNDLLVVLWLIKIFSKFTNDVPYN